MKETIILEGRYRITRCLAQRPRLNLYLGSRIATDEQALSFLSEPTKQDVSACEPLVAIRELVLTGLAPQIRALVEAAAFEEFVAPSVFGSPRLPTSGDRVWIDGEQHYLVTQLTDAKIPIYEHGTTLDALLLDNAIWPEWINEVAALDWATQLCRMVARLHRQGVVLGNLTPSSILVGKQGQTSWSPVLLPSWPPAFCYWKTTHVNVPLLYGQIFPIVGRLTDSVFAAPELRDGIADERSDVYALGAILYLLLTHFAPISSLKRQQIYNEQPHRVSAVRRSHGGSVLQERVEGLELVPLHFLNETISPKVEQIVLRALELEPAKRYSSMFAFVEALEAIVL